METPTRRVLSLKKTNYANHDEAYQRFLREDVVGWDQTEEAYRVRQQELVGLFAAGRTPRSGRLLEIGCGAGNMTVWFASLGYRAFGIDISPTAIAWARERARSCGATAEFEVANVVSMDSFNEGPFDIIVDGHCLHCIIGGDCARLLSAVFRLLEPGGYFLVDTMCQPVRPGGFEFYDEAERATIYKGTYTRYIGTPKEIADEVRAAGLEVLHSTVTPGDDCSMLLLEATRPRASASPRWDR